MLAGWSPELIESVRPRLDECGTMEGFVKDNGELFISCLSKYYTNQQDCRLKWILLPSIRLSKINLE